MAESRIRITQTKSEIRQPASVRRTLRALGLKGYQKSAEQPDNPAIRGMIGKVRHMVAVEEA
jgi:large subunit ribosomal protein L30